MPRLYPVTSCIKKINGPNKCQSPAENNAIVAWSILNQTDNEPPYKKKTYLLHTFN